MSFFAGAFSQAAFDVNSFLFEAVTQPENGPSGGASWLNGYVPAFGVKPKRRGKRDELLFLTV